VAGDAGEDGLFSIDPAQRIGALSGVLKPAVDETFRAFDPGQGLLLPPSLDDWLAAEHLVRFIAELVDEHLDLSRIQAGYTEGRGGPPYDPQLMVRILLYGYTIGVRSSRAIEVKCTDDVAFRWLASGADRIIGRSRSATAVSPPCEGAAAPAVGAAHRPVGQGFLGRLGGGRRSAGASADMAHQRGLSRHRRGRGQIVLVPNCLESALRQPIPSAGHRHRDHQPDAGQPPLPWQPPLVFTMTPHTTRLLVLTHGDAADPIPSAAQQTASVIAASASSRRPTSANRLDWLVNDLAGSGPSPGLKLCSTVRQ
jgi:hypothetical protein